MKLRHIALPVPDVAAARKFFEEAFGMTKAGDPTGIVSDVTASGWKRAVKNVKPMVTRRSKKERG